ncbi:MAG: type II toxin-antitoxin system VapC family toxin [Roseiarcus sp.]
MSDAFVLDASALLCLLHRENGADRVAEALPQSVISAVNLSEAIAKLAEAGLSGEHIAAAMEALQLAIVSFDEEQAQLAGLLRPKTKRAGLSFGDRACLALGQKRGAIVLTCDNAWSNLVLDIAVEQLR